MSIEFGQVVRYANPLNEAEGALRFVVVGEPDKGRVDIQLVCDWRIKPIETVETTEVCPA